MARRSDPVSRERTYIMTPQMGNVTLIINFGGSNNAQGGSGAELNSLTLPITPEDIQISRPSRQAVTQTLTSAYQDHLGSGIATVTMRGHTGWRNLTTEGDGFTVIKKLRDLLGQYDKTVATNPPDKVSLMLLLNLPSGWEHFRVSKTAVTYTRSRAQPLLYRYEVQFIVLHDFNDPTGQVDPSPNFIIQQGVFPDVVLNPLTQLPDSTTNTGNASTGGTGRGGPQDIIGDQTRDTIDPRLEPPKTGSTSPIGVPVTLAEFVNQQYPPVNGYPPGMFNYILAANPDFFTQNSIDPNTYLLVPGTTLRVPQITVKDVYAHTEHGKVTAADVTSYNGFIQFTDTVHGLYGDYTVTRGISNRSVTILGEDIYRGWDVRDGTNTLV